MLFLFCRHLLLQTGNVTDIVPDRHMRKKFRPLHRIADLPAQSHQIAAGQRFSVDNYFSFCRRYDTVDHLEQRRLPAAGRADDHHQLPLLYR